jgi:DNA-binding response OmpR family regulator
MSSFAKRMNAHLDVQERAIRMMGARILLVEDDAVLSDLIRLNLCAREHEVHVVRDAHEALMALRDSTFDLVFLDINLPDQTGWDVLRTALQEGTLRLQPFDGNEQMLPVVVLSAVRVSPRRLAEFHPLAYLPKPFPMEALLRLATEAAQRSNGHTQPEQQAADAPFSPYEEDSYA